MKRLLPLPIGVPNVQNDNTCRVGQPGRWRINFPGS